jgi:dUTP pyrophosphatase
MDGIAYEPLFADVISPERATQGAAGYDVRAYLRGREVRMMRRGAPEVSVVGDAGALWLEPAAIALVPLGFRARLPEGYEAQIRLRSSIAFKKGLVLPNAPGTIDADYPDEWLVMVKNDSARGVSIEHGERIAQVVLSRFEVLPWVTAEVSRSTDRIGGLGSTG